MRLKACIEHASHRDDGTGRARSWVKDSLVDGGALRGARIEPSTTRTTPIAMPSVNGSPRTATPSARGTPGIPYVITGTRGPPTSARTAKTAPMDGTAAIRRPVSELEIRRSASDRKNHGAATSTKV